MAVYTSTATGNWSAGATWVGGIKPPSAGGHSIVIASGHTVTFDEAAGEYGDDTTTAFTINGKLSFSRAMTTQLTVNGHIFTAAATTATFDMGSSASPIPSTYTATLILNKSGAMANYKYGLFIADTSNASIYGATRTVNTTLVSTISAGATSFDVADGTGWAVGDRFVLAETSGTVNHYDTGTISTITLVSGTRYTITCSALTYGHAANCPVGNMSSNVTIKSYNTTNPSYVCFRHTSTASDGRRELRYASFQMISNDTANVSTKVFVSSSTGLTTSPFTTFSDCSFYNCQTNPGLFLSQWISNGFTISNLGMFTDNGGTSQGYYLASGTYINMTGCVHYYGSAALLQSAFSQGGQGCTMTNCKFWATAASGCVNINPGNALTFVNCDFHSASAGQALIHNASGDVKFTGCNFGSSNLPGTPSPANLFNTTGNSIHGQVSTALATDCYFGTPVTSFVANLSTANPQWKLIVANKNVDPSVQEIYTPAGYIVRDNTSKITGVTSLKMSPISSTNALTFILYVPAPTGKKVGVSGYLWRDTANTTTVTLSGLGITPSVYTASGSLSANEQFFVSGTQTTGTDGFFTLTFSTIGTTGNLWVDSISAPQAAAIDFGEFGYWANGLPAQIVSANYVSASDVWNTLVSNITVAGSIGKQLKDYARNFLNI